MAIYDIFEPKESAETEQRQMELDFGSSSQSSQESTDEIWSWSRLFSATAVRTFFFLLFLADILWGLYVAIMLLLCNLAVLGTFGASERVKKWRHHYWLSLKRFLVCGMSLIVALFAPAFGILIACTYFLMYDKAGIDEVVPASLQEQFKEFFPRTEQ